MHRKKIRYCVGCQGVLYSRGTQNWRLRAYKLFALSTSRFSFIALLDSLFIVRSLCHISSFCMRTYRVVTALLKILTLAILRGFTSVVGVARSLGNELAQENFQFIDFAAVQAYYAPFMAHRSVRHGLRTIASHWLSRACNLR